MGKVRHGTGLVTETTWRSGERRPSRQPWAVDGEQNQEWESLGSTLGLVTSFIHPLIQQVFIEGPQCARSCVDSPLGTGMGSFGWEWGIDKYIAKF